MSLSQLDMLSPHITLYYKQKNTHSSVISGILTICAYLSILTFVLIYLVRYINRENPTAYFFNRYVDDVGEFSFKDLNFFNFIQITQGRDRSIKDLDFNKIEIIGVNISMQGFKSISDLSHISHWIYDKCDNETDIKGIEHLLNNETFYKSACIKKFYNNKKSEYYDINNENFEWPNINQGASNPNSSLYGVVVKKCENTSFRLQYFEECRSENEINEYLRTSFISFTTIDHYVDILNYKNPITKFLFNLNNIVNSDSYIINNLNFYPGLVKSYDNLFFDKSVEQIAYFFHQNSQTTSISQDSKYLCAFFIWLQNTQQYYERRYHKLREVLPEIGGYSSAVMMISKFINYLIFRFILLSDTQKLISDFLVKNYSVYENIRKSPSITNLLRESIGQKNNQNQSIKVFDPGQNDKIIRNTENSEIGKDDNDKIINNINKRINVINSNNLGEETNRMNKNNEDSRDKAFSEQKSNAFETIHRKYTKNGINNIISHIDKKKSFNCFDYLCYLVFCKKINSNIKYYEKLRREIISEECIFQNFFYIYKLLEAHKSN